MYETDPMELDDVNLTSGLSRKDGLYIRVVGQCAGEQCAPSDYTIIFGKDGFQPVQLQSRDIALSIGSETMSWEDPQSRSVDQGSTIRSGTFARVDLTAEQLSTLASVSNVRGSVGDVGFSISYEERAPLRALLSRLSEAENENGREEGA